LKSRAVGFVPAKADSEKQKNFRDDILLPLIEKAKNSEIALFFMDASHFVMGGFPARVWSIVRTFVKTSSGRKRFNVLGALNFATHKIETVVNDTYITGAQVVELLEKLAAKYSESITVVLDNAAYQRCNFVKEAALRLGINLVFLPTYSPNLNLIERVWKLVKSKVLAFAYFDTFSLFSSKIHNCVEDLHTECKSDLSSLISSNFQIIDNYNVRFK
jgi:transposase